MQTLQVTFSSSASAAKALLNTRLRKPSPEPVNAKAPIAALDALVKLRRVIPCSSIQTILLPFC
jgi:hypothetical protein